VLEETAVAAAAAVVVGGPAGLPPPFFLFWGENSKIYKPRKRGKIDGPRITISIIPNFNASSRPLAWATIPIAVLSNCQLWRQEGMEHIVLHALSSPELAILHLRQ
jgi:hypothetical protein